MVTRTKNQNTFSSGNYNALCDVCSFKFKATDLRKRWDGLYVCKDDYEPRHVGDFFESPVEDTSVPWSRPDNNEDSSYTDVAGNAVTTDNTIDTHSDTDATITWGTSHSVHNWNTSLSSNRTVTIANGTADGKERNRFTIYRTGGGAFTLDVGGIRTIPASVNAVIVVEFDGTSWLEVAYTTLGI